MINRIKRQRHRLRWQLFFVLLLFGTVSLSLFQTLWRQQSDVYQWIIRDFPFLPFPSPDGTLWMELSEAAAQCEIPDSDDDVTKIEQLKPFFDLADEYTSIYIYGTEDGLFRAGVYASKMDTPQFRSFFDLGYNLTMGAGEESFRLTMKFKNGYADVWVFFYHSSWFVYPYFYFCLIFCMLLFLAAVLGFVGCKMRHIVRLEQEILRMSSGDLDHPVPACGHDEIGTLAKELDCLRQTLSSNIRREQESRRANQDLITAMSHDLRTPLTILNGYLEILKLGRNPVTYGEYLDRCLKKTGEIRELTDRMFEYALVYEETETANLAALPTAFLQQCLTEHADYLRLVGFTANLSLPTVFSRNILGDEAMLRRVFSNLFSNILKYGDKKTPVQITGAVELDQLTVTLSNTVRQEYVRAESNHIGLKSVQKMMTLMEGGFEVQSDMEYFTVRLSFPLSETPMPFLQTLPERESAS